METPVSTIAHLEPELIHIDGEFCPSKNLNFKQGQTPGVLTHWFRSAATNWESRVRNDLAERLDDVDLFPTDKEVHIAITFGLPSREKYNKGDVDNKAKTVIDALVGPVYLDDNQVKILWVDKKYEEADEDWCLISVKLLN